MKTKTATKPESTLRITIEGATREELAQSLAALLLRERYDDEYGSGSSIQERAQKIAEKQLSESVRDGVVAAVKGYTADKAREVVDAYIADGVVQTDGYGSVRSKLTWAQFITQMFIGDRDRGDRNNLNRIASEAVNELFGKRLKGLLDEVTAQVRAQVDEAVGIKIKAAIREGAGIK